MMNVIIIALSAALVSCSTVRTPMIRTFSAPEAAQPIGPYSHGVECSGRMIFMSGQIPLRADGTMVEGSIQDQTKQVFANIRTVLASQGATLSDVVKTTVFLQSMNDFAGMNEVYASEMGDHRPARSAVEVAKLPKNALVEIEVIACMP
jgi:2-iminobutanoate/2-iminopropanoate deaminase